MGHYFCEEFGYRMHYFDNTTYYDNKSNVIVPRSVIKKERDIKVLVLPEEELIILRYNAFDQKIFPNGTLMKSGDQCSNMEQDNSILFSRLGLFYSNYKTAQNSEETQHEDNLKIYSFSDRAYNEKKTFASFSTTMFYFKPNMNIIRIVTEERVIKIQNGDSYLAVATKTTMKFKPLSDEDKDEVNDIVPSLEC